MQKPLSEPISREMLRSLSRSELEDIILQRVTRTEPSSEEVTDSARLATGPLFESYEALSYLITQNLPNGAVAVIDRSLTYVHVAGQEMRRFGLTASMFVGHQVGVLTSEEEGERVRRNFMRVLSGESCRIEVTIRGEVYLVSAAPLSSVEGQVNHILSVIQNITEQRKTLRQIQEREAQYRTLVENIPGAVYISNSDPKRKILHVDEKIQQLCGYTADDFKSGRINSKILMHPDDQPQAKQRLKKAMRKNKPYHFLYRWRHRDGQYHWIEEYGMNIVKDEQQYFQGVLFDVSEKKHYERELQQQNEELKKKNSELDHFAYRVSHDLRAPLTSALGLLQILQEEPDAVKQREYAGAIQRSLLRLDRLIQEATHLTRNARTELSVKAIDLPALITEVVDSQQHSKEFSTVNVRIEVNQAVDFYTDSDRLRIVLNNLITNAVKYHFPFREQSYVRINVATDQQGATLVIEDNGIGIKERHLGKIFDMFYRATDRQPGSGLGLYLVKETIEKLYGSVEVRSMYEQGTTFVVRLPNLKESVANAPSVV